SRHPTLVAAQPQSAPQPGGSLVGFRQRRSLRQLAATLHRTPSGSVHALLCDAFAHGSAPQGWLVLPGVLASQSVSFIMTTCLGPIKPHVPDCHCIMNNLRLSKLMRP